jgi:two-component system, NarL family, invasion response regulator UvrY
MKNEPIRIILVDDHKLVRQSWKMLLENNPQFKVVADCENGESAIEETKKHTPDIILVDINMSPDNGFIVTEQILRLAPATKIIGISANNQPKYATRMLGLGAKGYLTKTSSLEEINHGINEVYDGRFYICNEIKKHMPPSE